MPAAEKVAIRRVEVRTWPQRVDLFLIDPITNITLAHFPLDDEFAGPVFDPLAPYNERANDALYRLEKDQSSLRWHYGLDCEVKLGLDGEMRAVLAETLDKYGLELDLLELASLYVDPYWLEHLGAPQLFRLLCDWIDVAERHYPVGSTLAIREPNHWTYRSRPDIARQFHALAGVEKPDTGSDPQAYAIFCAMVDAPLPQFSLGLLLRWLYYHLTEFSDRRPIPLPKALNALRARV